MWPWGHLAVGYLLYSVTVRLFRTSSERIALGALVVGTQFPDLVDKPLAWVGILGYGRSLAHSLLVLVPCCLLVVGVARHLHVGHAGWAFALGSLSHVLGDAWHGLVAFDFGELGFLLWPLVPSPDGGVGSAAGHASNLAAQVDTPSTGPSGLLDVVGSDPVTQALLLVFAAAVWVREGAPGLRN
jgi:hypothetical protein